MAMIIKCPKCPNNSAVGPDVVLPAINVVMKSVVTCNRCHTSYTVVLVEKETTRGEDPQHG
jgi:predicted nucleic-acid-binding Zn-ribbon protein